jgi:threonine aldolase
MIADFRSDTLTKPTKLMLEAMFLAEVGDDVFGEDQTVIKLEKLAASMFGKEAALFCPSGTMANQIAIKAHTNAPGELICDQLSHVYLYEVGGIAFHSGLNVNLTAAERGILQVEDIMPRINPEADMHKAMTQLVVLENTCNKGGGSCYELENLKSISKFCREKNIRLHLDGARVFNAMVTKGYSASALGEEFDSISVCLSKGLGTPMGSVLIGNSEFIGKAKRLRKLFGGGMRQIGYMAAAGIYALENHIERLAEDHRRAELLGYALQKASFTEEIFPIETNIVIVKLKPEVKQAEFLSNLASKGVKAVPFGPQLVRFVTHLDIGDKELNFAAALIGKM